MKLLLPIHSSIRALGASLFDSGLRVREDYGELVLNQSGFGLRIHSVELSAGSMLHCIISVAEQGFIPGSLGLFEEMAAEGYPVVAVGACGGRISCEFNWFHPEGADWRISAQRCQALVDRVLGARVPPAEPKAIRAGGRRAARLRAVA
jgi:hypothetical protein